MKFILVYSRVEESLALKGKMDLHSSLFHQMFPFQTDNKQRETISQSALPFDLLEDLIYIHHQTGMIQELPKLLSYA